VLELIEFLGRVVEGALGVRFVFSPSYRARTRLRWKNSSWAEVITECIGAIIGTALLVLIAVFVVRSLFGVWE
jgi:uncharacterized membrane protein YfcA